MCSKHVEAWNKTYCETKTLCIMMVNYWDKYTEMHGQQNVKKNKHCVLYIVYCILYIPVCKNKSHYIFYCSLLKSQSSEHLITWLQNTRISKEYIEASNKFQRTNLTNHQQRLNSKILTRIFKIYQIRGDCEDCLMGCDTVQSGWNVHPFVEAAGFAETSEDRNVKSLLILCLQ